LNSWSRSMAHRFVQAFPDEYRLDSKAANFVVF